MKESSTRNRFTAVLLIIYLVALTWILLFKLGVHFSYMEKRSVNLIPFSEFFIPNGKTDLSEIILNIVVFIPFGIYAGVLCKRWKWLQKFLLFFLVSFMIEGIQYIFRIGAFDTTDTITNTFGGLTGLLIFEAIEKIFSNSVKAQKFINIAAAIATFFIILMLSLLKLNLLPVRYQ